MTTGKMQRLSQQFKNDKCASEKAKKDHANELLQQSAEKKKLSMELSKLKVYHVHYLTPLSQLTSTPSLSDTASHHALS